MSIRSERDRGEHKNYLGFALLLWWGKEGHESIGGHYAIFPPGYAAVFLTSGRVIQDSQAYIDSRKANIPSKSIQLTASVSRETGNLLITEIPTGETIRIDRTTPYDGHVRFFGSGPYMIAVFWGETRVQVGDLFRRYMESSTKRN